MAADVPWLRLAYDSKLVPKQKIRKPEQLSLPFEKSNVILVLNTKSIKSDLFIYALGSIRPHWIFDLRLNPRLDILAGSRREAFRYFTDFDVHYVDVFGLMELGERNRELRRKRRFVSILKENLSETADRNGPYLALLDDDNIMDVVKDSAPDVISALTGRPTALTQLAVGSRV